MESKESETVEEVKSNVPRAWGLTGLTFVLLMFLIIPQAATEFEGVDLRRGSIVLQILVLLVGLLIVFFLGRYAWELWTKNGKHNFFTIKGMFSLGGKTCGKIQIFFWWLVQVYLILACFGAIVGTMS